MSKIKKYTVALLLPGNIQEPLRPFPGQLPCPPHISQKNRRSFCKDFQNLNNTNLSKKQQEAWAAVTGRNRAGCQELGQIGKTEHHGKESEHGSPREAGPPPDQTPQEDNPRSTWPSTWNTTIYWRQCHLRVGKGYLSKTQMCPPWQKD